MNNLRLQDIKDNPKKIRVVFFDIDWTIYDDGNSRFSDKTIDAIKILKSNGVKTVLCTARPYHSIKDLGALDLGIEWDGIICSAGGVVYVGDECIKKDLMEPQDVHDFVEMVLNDGHCLEVVSPYDRILVGKQNQISLQFYDKFVEEIPNYGEYDGGECTGLNLFCPVEFDEEYTKRFPNIIYYRYSDCSVDVMPFERSKGEGVERVLDYLGLKKESSIGFGDDIQDIPLAESVGFFVCMGQGKEELKKIADYITKPVWEDGVATALEELNLI